MRARDWLWLSNSMSASHKLRNSAAPPSHYLAGQHHLVGALRGRGVPRAPAEAQDDNLGRLGRSRRCNNTRSLTRPVAVGWAALPDSRLVMPPIRPPGFRYLTVLLHDRSIMSSSDPLALPVPVLPSAARVMYPVGCWRGSVDGNCYCRRFFSVES